MKKLILTGMSLLFAITLTFAQETTPEQKAQEKVATLTEKLALTEEQQTAIYPILVEAGKTKEALKADTTLSEEDVKAQVEALKADSQKKIEEQLTEEQKAAFAQLIQEAKAEKQ